MQGGEHVADVSFSQRPKETTERKVSLMLILCTNLRSLPYLAVNHCYCNARKTPAVPKQWAQQDQSGAQPSDSGYHCSPAQAPVHFVLLHLLSPAELFAMETISVFQMWYRTRGQVPTVR